MCVTHKLVLIPVLVARRWCRPAQICIGTGTSANARWGEPTCTAPSASCTEGIADRKTSMAKMARSHTARGNSRDHACRPCSSLLSVPATTCTHWSTLHGWAAWRLLRMRAACLHSAHACALTHSSQSAAADHVQTQHSTHCSMQQIAWNSQIALATAMLFILRFITVYATKQADHPIRYHIPLPPWRTNKTTLPHILCNYVEE